MVSISTDFPDPDQNELEVVQLEGAQSLLIG